MNIYLDEIKFKVDDNSWGSKKQVDLEGHIKIGISEEPVNVMGESIHFYENRDFDIKRLPKEIQDKLVEVFKDVENYLEKF